MGHHTYLGESFYGTVLVALVLFGMCVRQLSSKRRDGLPAWWWLLTALVQVIGLSDHVAQYNGYGEASVLRETLNAVDVPLIAVLLSYGVFYWWRMRRSGSR